MPEPIPSPCIGVCKMDDRFCAGCFRSMKEIIRWEKAGDDEKRQILAAVAQRRGQSDAGSGRKPGGR